jgi:voltage-gated potassium channel
MGKEVSLMGKPIDEVDPRYLTYNIFIMLITVLALISMLAYYLFPLPREVIQVLKITDLIACTLLMFDFFLNWYISADRRYYLLRYGWIDFLGSIPGLLFFRFLRIFRMFRIFRNIRQSTSEELLLQARKRLGESTMLVALLMLYVVVTLGSIAIVLVESPDSQANIQTGGDAVWWAFVTIATVGYGDKYPVTSTGRGIGILMMVVGVSIFSVLTGFLALSFQNRRAKQQQEAITAMRNEFRNELKRSGAAEQKDRKNECSSSDKGV